MGSTLLTRTRSLERFFPNFRIQDWVEVYTDEDQVIHQHGNYTTLRNVISGFEIDRYEIIFTSDREQRIYEECFMQRLREDYLINAYHYEPVRSRGLCSNFRGAIVYIYHIPIRLSDIDDIPFDESLFMMKCSLLGFERLYKESGYFSVMEQHIGICKMGKVRVWLNKDLSKNYPFSQQQQNQQGMDYQRIMVSQIIKLIQTNTNFQCPDYDYNNNSTYTAVSEYMKKNGYMQATFRQALECINQYCNHYDIVIPKRCLSVIKIFREANGEPMPDQTCQDFNIRDQEIQRAYQGMQGEHDEHDAREQERQHVYLLSQRSKNQLANNNPFRRPASGEQAGSDTHHMSYKEYQPTSTYKPNNNYNNNNHHIRNSQQSACSDDRSKNSQGIKLKSQQQQQINYQKNGNGICISSIQLPELVFISNSKKNSRVSSKGDNSRVSNNSPVNQKKPKVSDLYKQKSYRSSKFYDEIDKDFNLLCSDRSSSHRCSQQCLPVSYKQQSPKLSPKLSPKQAPNSTSNQPTPLILTMMPTLIPSIPHPISQHSVSSSHNSQNIQHYVASSNINHHHHHHHHHHHQPQHIQKPKSPHQPQQENILRRSSASISKSNNSYGSCVQANQILASSSQASDQKIQNIVVPKVQKVNFTYMSRSVIQNKEPPRKVQVNHRSNGHISEKKQLEIDEEFRRDMEEELEKDKLADQLRKRQQNIVKKVYVPQERIQEAEQEQQIDPEIMSDLIIMESRQYISQIP